MQPLFYEKSVNSFDKLMEEVNLLDLDSGIRTFGDYNGKSRQFVFVTRSPHDSYTLMVYEKKTAQGKPFPGRRLLVKKFSTKEDLGEFIKGRLSRPIKAFIY